MIIKNKLTTQFTIEAIGVEQRISEINSVQSLLWFNVRLLCVINPSAQCYYSMAIAKGSMHLPKLTMQFTFLSYGTLVHMCGVLNHFLLRKPISFQKLLKNSLS